MDIVAKFIISLWCLQNSLCYLIECWRYDVYHPLKPEEVYKKKPSGKNHQYRPWNTLMYLFVVSGLTKTLNVFTISLQRSEGIRFNRSSIIIRYTPRRSMMIIVAQKRSNFWCFRLMHDINKARDENIVSLQCRSNSII